MKKLFWFVLLLGNLIDSDKCNLNWERELFCWKSMHTCKISCSVKNFSLSGILSCSGFQSRGQTHRTLAKLSILINIYLFIFGYWGVPLCYLLVFVEGNGTLLNLINRQACICTGLVHQGVLLIIHYPGRCTCSKFFLAPEHMMSWENELVLNYGKMTWEKNCKNNRFNQDRFSDFLWWTKRYIKFSVWKNI